MPSEHEVLVSAVETFGALNQHKKLIEEIGELLQLLPWCREELRGPADLLFLDRVAEEMADVLLLVQQVVVIHRLEDDLQRIDQTRNEPDWFHNAPEFDRLVLTATAALSSLLECVALCYWYLTRAAAVQTITLERLAESILDTRYALGRLAERLGIVGSVNNMRVYKVDRLLRWTAQHTGGNQ